jgi:hypothetical protein
MEIMDPIWTKSNTEQDEPSLACSYNERLVPNRAKEATDRLELIDTKSITE